MVKLIDDRKKEKGLNAVASVRSLTKKKHARSVIVFVYAKTLTNMVH